MVAPAYAQKRIAGEERVDDLLGVRGVVIEADGGRLPQIRKAEAGGEHGLALLGIHGGPRG